jgi:hypothetical protein
MLFSKTGCLPEGKLMTLDHEKLEAININGMDLVLLLLNLTIELVANSAATTKIADERLTDLANSLEGFARKVTEPRTKLLITQLAHGLISTERTS